jgi:hypothetical protein
MALRYSVNARSAQWRVVDGEAVIVHVDSSHYYALNRTGTFVWSLLAEAPRTIDEVTERVADDYGVPRDTARADVEQVLHDLLGEGLVEEQQA